MYYTTKESMDKRFDRTGRQDRMDLSGMAAFLSWQKKARKKLRELLCIDSIIPSPLEPLQLERASVTRSIIREKWVITTEEGVKMPFYILIPASASRRTPVYITAPGHLGGGKESLAGNRLNPLVSEKIDFYGYDYALFLAEHGYVSVAFDPRGFGERREAENQGNENILSSSCFQLAHMAESLGLTLTGLLVFDMMRLVDYITERNEWGEIRALGFSGGGLQTLYFSAIDERVRMAFISGYFYGFKEALLDMSANCSCNYIPSLYLHFDIQDIAALIAPRPLVIQSAREDHLAGINGLRNVLSPMTELKEAYSLLDADKRLFHHVVEGGHHFEKTGALEAIEKVCSD